MNNMYLSENYTIENCVACLGWTGEARARLEGQVKAKDTENCPLTTIARGMLTCLIRTLKYFFGLHFIRLQYSFVHDKNWGRCTLLHSPFTYYRVAFFWQRYTYRVLQTIQMKLILLCVWAEAAVLGSTKTALKFKYEI